MGSELPRRAPLLAPEGSGVSQAPVVSAPRLRPGFLLLTVGDVGGPTDSPSVAGGIGGGRAGVRMHGLLHALALGVDTNTFCWKRA